MKSRLTQQVGVAVRKLRLAKGWTLQRMPSDERTTGTAASREGLERFMRSANAQLWVGHDINAFSRQRKAPAFYE